MRHLRNNLTRGCCPADAPHLGYRVSTPGSLFSWAAGTNTDAERNLPMTSCPGCFSMVYPAELRRGGNVRICSGPQKEGGLRPLALDPTHPLSISMRDQVPSGIPSLGKRAPLTADKPAAAAETSDLRWYHNGRTGYATRRPFRRTFFQTRN